APSPRRRAPTRQGRSMAVSTIEQTGDVPEAEESPQSEPVRIDPYPWRRALVWSAIAYVLSRAAVLAGAGAAGAAANPRPDNGTKPILNVLTGWDGKWYFAVARTGYPHHIPPHITFNQPEARAAFFPLYPRVVWAVNKILPGGDTLVALGLNLVFGAIFVLLVGLMTRRFYGNKAAARAMVLTALFPGSFVLSYAYSEAL